MTTPSPNPTWHRWGKRLLIAGAAGALVFIALTLVLSRFLDPEALANRVEPRLESALSREVEVGRVEVGFFPLAIRLAEVSVADPTGLAPFLARVDAVEFRVALLPLLRKDVRVSRLVLDNPEANLRIGPDGRSNFGDLSAESDPTGPEGADETGAFGLDLRAIRISGGLLLFENPEDSTFIRVEDLQARASVSREADGPWYFDGRSAGVVAFAEGASPGETDARVSFSLVFDLEAGPTFETLEIRSGNVEVDPMVLAVAGRIEGFKEPVRTLSLDLMAEGTPLTQLVEGLSDRLGFTIPGEVLGSLDARIRVDGPFGPDRTPDISGTVTVTRGGLEARDGTFVAQDLAATFTLVDPDRVQIQIAGELLDGPFSAEGNADLGEPGALNLRVRGNPDLALVGSAVQLPEGVSTEGRLETDLRITGSYRNLRSLRFWGDASPSDVVVTHPGVAVPIGLRRGRISVVGDGVTFVDLPISVGTDNLVVTGEIQNLMAYGLPMRTVGVRGTVRGPRLDLTKISPRTPPDSALTYGRIAFARMGNRPVAGRPVEDAARELRLSRPDSLLASGELQLAVDTLIYARGRLDEVRAKVEFGRSVVKVTEASMKRFGGEIWTSMNLALGSGLQQPFSLAVRARDLNAGQFLGETSPIGGVLRGRLSLDLDLVGSLDGLLLPDRNALVGTGNFSLIEGGLSSTTLTQALSAFLGGAIARDPTINDWSTSFIMENGRIRLADGRLAGSPGEPIVGGSLGFDGGLDLLSTFEIDADRLGTYALNNLGIQDALAGRMAGRPGIVQAVVRIGGTLFAPEFRGGPAATTGAIVQSVREEARAEAERQIQQGRAQLQNRATGFLRGFLQPRDTAAARPPDSVGGVVVPADSLRGDTTRPDTVRTDTIRPDTVRPDTLRPDTVRPDTTRPDTSRLEPPPQRSPQHHSPSSRGGGVLWRGSATMSQGAPRNSTSNQSSKVSQQRSSGHRL